MHEPTRCVVLAGGETMIEMRRRFYWSTKINTPWSFSFIIYNSLNIHQVHAIEALHACVCVNLQALFTLLFIIDHALHENDL